MSPSGTEFVGAVGERAGRHIDRIVDRALALPHMLQDGAGLGARAAAEFRDHQIGGQEIDEILRVRVDHAGVRARQAVFGQKRDGFEEGRTDVVVEIAAGQRLLLGLGQAGPHVARELCVQRLGEH